MFVSPAGGVVKEVRRGLRRRLLDIVIEVAKTEEYVQLPAFNVQSATRKS